MIRKSLSVLFVLLILISFAPNHYYNQLEVGPDYLRWEPAISEAFWYQWTYQISPRGYKVAITDVIYSVNPGGQAIIYTAKPNRANNPGIYEICASWPPYGVVRCESLIYPQ